MYSAAPFLKIMEKHKFIELNQDAIKYLAVFGMLLNHIAHGFLVPGTLPFEACVDIGYVTAITMIYFLVEGYGYTRNVKKYAVRLFIFGVVSELPFCMAFSETGKLHFVAFDMMFSLFFCLLLCIVIDTPIDQNKRTAFIGLIFIACAFSDWSCMAPAFTLLFMRARGNRELQKKFFGYCMLAFAAMQWAVNMGSYSFGTSILLTLGNVAGMGLAYPLIFHCYSGKRSKHFRTFHKWFFYLFYPMHLLIIGLLRMGFPQ